MIVTVVACDVCKVVTLPFTGPTPTAERVSAALAAAGWQERTDAFPHVCPRCLRLQASTH